jgi:hypothetical protein
MKYSCPHLPASPASRSLSPQLDRRLSIRRRRDRLSWDWRRGYNDRQECIRLESLTYLVADVGRWMGDLT